MQLSRRTAVTGGLASAGLAAGGWLGYRAWEEATGPDLHIPDVPAGEVRLERVTSAARRREVDLFTAVPDGHGDGRGLPVCLVLHGASHRARDSERFGIPKLLTAAVRAGTPPFVLAGADGGAQRWQASGDDDPMQMVIDEMPRWLDARGFRTDAVAAWGWSMGGYGALRLAQQEPDWVRAVAAFSPAIGSDDAVFADVAAFRGTPVGLWCGTDDPYYSATRELAAALPESAAVTSYGNGFGHNMEYWTRVAEDAFTFLGMHLA